LVQVVPGSDRILVTGANGFVGSALCRALAARGYRVRAAVRAVQPPSSASESVVLGEIHASTDWTAALSGVTSVVHLAARAHASDAHDRRALEAYRTVNVQGTRGLAEAAAGAGIARLVYLSSIKVNGESTGAKPFNVSNEPKPEDAYGLSKWEAERALMDVARGRGLEVVILRPPLVYGPGVKGNLLRLLRLVDRGIPLPVASVHNRRSLIYLDNLTDAILLCLRAREAAGRTYLPCDGEDRSTPALIEGLAAALGRPARLFPFPVALLRLAGTLTGASGAIGRLTQSLQVDSTALRDELGWSPRHTVAEGITATGAWYRAQAPR
jgi:nucleoside-diphosphate-sugar epimerase